MTKHNLKDHLGWLIKSKPTFSSCPLTVQVESFPEAASIFEADNTLQHRSATPTVVPVSSTKGSGDGSPQGETSDFRFLRPTIPTSFLNGEGRDVMARLKSGPKVDNKPRLLSEQLPTSIQPSLPPVRTPGVSLTETFIARYDSHSDSNISNSKEAFFSNVSI